MQLLSALTRKKERLESAESAIIIWQVNTLDKNTLCSVECAVCFVQCVQCTECLELNAQSAECTVCRVRSAQCAKCSMPYL